MKKNDKDKSLVKVKKNNIWNKIRNFFKKEKIENNIISIETNNKTKNDIQKEKFIEYVKNIENEETKLMKLQERYRSGEIKEEDLTEEQVKKLCDLYDKQIENLQKSNSIRKEKIFKFKKSYNNRK